MKGGKGLVVFDKQDRDRSSLESIGAARCELLEHPYLRTSRAFDEVQFVDFAPIDAGSRLRSISVSHSDRLQMAMSSRGHKSGRNGILTCRNRIPTCFIYPILGDEP